MIFDPKLGNDTFEIRCITCACNQFISTLYKLWTPGVPQYQQPRYQPVKDFTYWFVVGSFNN